MPATDHDIQDRVGKADIAEEGQQQDASKAPNQSGETIKSYRVQLRTSPTLVAEHPADFWNNYEIDIQLAAGLGVPVWYNAATMLLSPNSKAHLLGMLLACVPRC